MSILESFFTIQFLLVLVATVVASARGWNLVPFVLLGLSQIPKVYAHVTPLSLNPHDLITLGVVNGTVMLILYAALGLMILLPRRDPSRSSIPTILVAVAVGGAPWLCIQYLGGLDVLTGGGSAAGAKRTMDGDVADAPKQTSLPDRLVGRWQGTGVIDPEGLERFFEDQETLPDYRRVAPELLSQMRLSVEYRSDGTSTTTVSDAVVSQDKRVMRVTKPFEYSEAWKLIDQKPHSLQIESLENGAVIAITFLGDDVILYDKVSGKQSAFVDHYRLERQTGGWW